MKKLFILFLLLSFCGNVFSQNEESSPAFSISTFNVDHSTTNVDLEDVIDDVFFEYHPTDFSFNIYGIDFFFYNLYYREIGGLIIATYDGKYEIYIAPSGAGAEELSEIPEFIEVKNKNLVTVQTSVWLDENVYSHIKYYDNGNIMFLGTYEVISKRKNVFLSPSNKWYMFSDYGEYVAVGDPKGNNKLTNWRIFRNDNIQIFDSAREELIKEFLNEENQFIKDPDSEHLPYPRFIDAYGGDEAYHLTEDVMVEFGAEAYPISQSWDISNFDNNWLIERNNFVMIENGNKIKLIDLFNKLNSYKDQGIYFLPELK